MYEMRSWFGLVCWSLTSLCHSNGHIETKGDEVMNGIISALITTRHYHFKVARLTEKHIYTVWNTRVNDMIVCIIM